MSNPDLTVPAMRASRLGPLAAAVLTLALGGCGANHVVSNDWKAPPDYRERHPIVLSDKSRTLDLFVGANSSRLDPRQSEDLTAFVREFQERGKGAMTAFVPVGSATPAADAHGVSVVRAALAARRVPVAVRSYAVADPTLAAPIRLSFAELTASVPHRCGQWPGDLSGSGSMEGVENNQYWNFGCAYQQNIAAMVADPVDLVRPQVETRIDVIKRSNEITKLRQGMDPATKYDTQNKAAIGKVGGGD
jgi:pilus assembly protein CpaD